MKPAARIAIAISFAVFALQQIAYHAFVTRAIGTLQPWIPWHPVWAYITGFLLLAGAVAMLAGKPAGAIATGIGCLVAALLIHLPKAIASPANGGLWVFFGKGLTLAGCAFVVAASLGPGAGFLQRPRLLLAGRCFLGSFMILSGALHFVYRDFVVSIMQPWIPFHLFWVYFAGVALIAGGAGMILPVTSQPALLLSGIMILAWVPLVHLPLALRNLRDANQTTAVFEALAFGSMAILAYLVKRSSRAYDSN